jgi:hypothetical protein
MLRIIIFLSLLSCTSYEKYQYLTEELQIPQENFNADFQEIWSAVINVMKKYDIEVQNQETGVIKTRWIDNTLEMNFADSFGSSDKIKTAKFKILVNVSQTYRSNSPVSKVTVFKRQLVEKDFLQGWRELKNDQILETTILYRVKRYVSISKYLKKIQAQNEKEEIENFL